jgi:hypothetical protein
MCPLQNDIEVILERVKELEIDRTLGSWAVFFKIARQKVAGMLFDQTSRPG